jgi:hypothetical protein
VAALAQTNQVTIHLDEVEQAAPEPTVVAVDIVASLVALPQHLLSPDIQYTPAVLVRLDMQSVDLTMAWVVVVAQAEYLHNPHLSMVATVV